MTQLSEPALADGSTHHGGRRMSLRGCGPDPIAVGPGRFRRPGKGKAAHRGIEHHDGPGHALGAYRRCDRLGAVVNHCVQSRRVERMHHLGCPGHRQVFVDVCAHAVAQLVDVRQGSSTLRCRSWPEARPNRSRRD
jgi:hypothetical protein